MLSITLITIFKNITLKAGGICEVRSHAAGTARAQQAEARSGA